MDTLLQDLRYGLRMLAKNPVYTAVAVLTITLGIGANTAIFSVVTSVLLAPLPFSESERLVRVHIVQHPAGGQQLHLSLPPAAFHGLRERSQLLERIAAQRFRNLTLTGDGDPERIVGIGVSDQWLETLGVQPLLGRGFDAEEQRAGSSSRVALLSFGFWQRRYGGRSEILGRTLRLNDESYTVIGILPPQFRYPYNADLWLPTTFSLTATSPGDLNTTARLRPGVTHRQLSEELQAIAAQMQHELPNYPNLSLMGRPFEEEFRRDPNHTIAVLLIAVGFVLLIACVNVASLQLARSQSRTREMAIRASLGAARGRQIRQLLTESLLMASISGLCGVLLAAWISKWLTMLIPARLGEVLQQVRVDWTVLIFSAGVCLLTGILFGLAPALRLSHGSPVTALKEGGRSGSGASGGRSLPRLVISEIALAVVLLVGAGLMLRDFVRLARSDVGYETANLLKLNLGLPEPAYHDPARRVTATRQILDRLEAVPGVVAAGITTLQPIPRTSANNITPLTLERQSDPAERPPILNMRLVSFSYFRTLGMRLLRGRTFTDQDTETTEPVVLVNDTAARRFWPGEDPIGRRVKPGRPEDTAVEWHTVVGVVNDIAEPGQIRETLYRVYDQGTASQPAGLWLTTRVELLVRTLDESPSILGQIRGAVWDVDSTLPLFNVISMDSALAEPLSGHRLGAIVFIGFGAFGLLMAVLGTYGVIAFSVGQRIPEFGIRLALGAQPADLLRMVLLEGLRLVLIGLSLGVVAALFLSRLFTRVVSEVGPHDPITYVVAGLVLLWAGCLASYLPARRATKVDPLTALRYE